MKIQIDVDEEELKRLVLEIIDKTIKDNIKQIVQDEMKLIIYEEIRSQFVNIAKKQPSKYKKKIKSLSVV